MTGLLELNEPFVLLDFDGRRQLYRRPSRIIEVREPEQIVATLEGLRGQTAAGFIGYEAGYALEPRLRDLAAKPQPDEPPLLWFGVFDDGPEPAPDLPDGRGVWVGAPEPVIDEPAYDMRLATLAEHLLAGNIYQANFTFPAHVRFSGHPLALYTQLQSRAQARWGAVVFTGEHWIISCSPELFFTLEDGRVTTRPMKGTATPASDPELLRNDLKQRAENLMIVDLLRNDLSKIAVPGTVKASELLHVERYPTVLQMTSTVLGDLNPALGPVDVIKAMFPCGSVTGVPKISAMQIIHKEELRPRGVYTGSIGKVDPNGDAAFNVAIRTLTIRAGSDRAVVGLGSGIVADSIAEDEWQECLQKGKFIPSSVHFGLIETMRVEHGAIPDLHLHLDRLQASAGYFGFLLDREGVVRLLHDAARKGDKGRLKLTLSSDGQVDIESIPLVELPSDVRVAVLPLPVESHDFRLRHKTTDRAFYDRAREDSGCDEIVFLDGAGFVTEGSFTNVFVERDGKLVTPPLARGLLPGILRRKLLETGKAVEGDLTVEDLSAGFFIGNSLRGLVAATLAQQSVGETKEVCD
jgi:para-aminobenzoate synthetase/4-amino-4-deoxychorismate lyase